MTRESALGLAAMGCLLLLYLGFSGGMIAMRPEPVSWPTASEAGDPPTYRIVKTIRVCGDALSCRFATAFEDGGTP